MKYIFKPIDTINHPGCNTLYLCFEIAKILGGSLSVESEEGKGATFILDLETTYESV